MKAYSLFLIFFFSVIFSSCVTSIHRLVTYDKVVAEERVTGTWDQDGMKITVSTLFSSPLVQEYKGNNKNIFSGVEKKDSILLSHSYFLRYEKNGAKYDMMASFIRLNDQLFLDLIPVNVDSVSANSSFSGFKDIGAGGGDWVPSHTFAKVVFHGDKKMELQFLGSEYLVNEIEKGNVAIKHEKDDLFDSMVITASSEDLQKFLLKYGSDKRLYDKANTVTLVKQ